MTSPAYGSGPYGSGDYGSSYLFTPPTYTRVVLMEGSLRYSYDVSSTVYKDVNGVWQYKFGAYDGDLLEAEIILTSCGPVYVDTEIANELIAAGIGTIE